MVRILSFLLCALLLAPVAGVRAAMSTGESREVATIEQQTSRIRQLVPKHTVSVHIVSDSQFNAALVQLMHANTTEHDIDIGQTEEVMLGLLSPSQSLRKLTFGSSLSQVVGFYDPKHQVLWVRSDANKALGPERFNIAHEYTHALQDQYFHFSRLMPDVSAQQYRNTDAIGARHALTEGDAVETQNLFISKTYGAADIKALLQLENQPDNGPALPRSFETQMLFPYITGLAFVDALYKSGGFAAVDAAYRRPPNSTYVVMHPKAYLAGWKPAAVSLHTVAGFGDWHIEDDDVFGAFGYNLMFRQYLSESVANTATNGYRGDRYVLLSQGNRYAMLFQSIWTSAAAARLAQDDFTRALKLRFPHAAVSGAAARTVTYAAGAVYLGRVGSRLSMAYAPTAALARQLGTAATG